MIGDALRSALVIAHPGHELRVHGWMERCRPLTFVLTDGAGESGRARLAATADVLAAAGATPSGLFGRFSERALFAALLDRRFERFRALVDELADTFLAARIGCVVGDAAEGGDAAHDVCRLLIDVAIAVIRKEAVAPQNLAVPMLDLPDVAPAHTRGPALAVKLDTAAIERKLIAFRRHAAIPGVVREFEFEPDSAHIGREMFFPSAETAASAIPGRAGSDGTEQSTLLLQNHIRLLADSLRAHIGKRAG